MQDERTHIGFGLQLSAIRSLVRVGLALNKRFPTEMEWQDFLGSQVFLETGPEIAQLIADIQQSLSVSPELTPDAVQAAVAEHYPRALDAVRELADLVEVNATDLLAVIVG